MSRLQIFLSLAVIALLSACGDSNKNVTSSDTKAELKIANPFKHQMEALKKAKNLEKEMNKAVQDRLKSIDGQL